MDGDNRRFTFILRKLDFLIFLMYTYQWNEIMFVMFYYFPHVTEHLHSCQFKIWSLYFQVAKATTHLKSLV